MAIFPAILGVESRTGDLPVTQSVQWYLARDGQQFGPISEAEMAKLVELGHLQPTDLLWREGFPDWRPAMVVFPPQGRTLSRGPRLTRPDAGPDLGPDLGHDARHDASHGRLVAEPVADRSPADRAAGYGGEDAGRRPRRLGRILALLLLVVVLAGGAGAAYVYRAQLTGIVASMSAMPAMTAPSGAMAIADRKSLETPPLAGLSSASAETIDARLQATALWRVIKREFRDWYTQRINEAAALARDNKDDAVIGQLMARKLVELRRQQIANGLSATPEKLKMVASTYRDSLGRLRSHSAEACKGFIREGAAEPLIVALLQQGSEHTAHLQAGLTAVFEAIAEGRQLPRVYPRPTPAQREMLATDLAKRGWTQDDFQLLSSQQAMAQAPPEKVCQLVHELFEAQLSLPDPEAQLRLVVNALRPVFAR